MTRLPERAYNIKCEGYFDNNGKPLYDETTINYLTSGEQVNINAELEIWYENGDVIDYIDYEKYYQCMNYNKYDLRRFLKWLGPRSSSVKHQLVLVNRHIFIDWYHHIKQRSIWL